MVSPGGIPLQSVNLERPDDPERLEGAPAPEGGDGQTRGGVEQDGDLQPRVRTGRGRFKVLYDSFSIAMV